MPVAITPLPVLQGKDLSVPKTSMGANRNRGNMGTKRKIICFSGRVILVH
jgi:hypothetical protein